MLARQEDALTAQERAVLAFTDALYQDHRFVPDEVWEELRTHYDEAATVEIAWTVASYMMFGKLIHAFEVPYGENGPVPQPPPS